MSAYKKILTGLLTAAALVATAGPAMAADLLECPFGESIYGQIFEQNQGDRGLDDGSQATSGFDFLFPDGLKFKGVVYDSLYININGNVTFANYNSTYTPHAIPGLSFPALAPFYADIDLRDDTTGWIYFCGDSANKRLIITWDRVGYYSRQTDKRNSFQLVLTNTKEECTTSNVTSVYDVEFRYNRLEWTTGDASGGDEGLGGTPATAGIDDGGGNAVALPGSGTSDVLELVNLSNVGEPGVFRYRVADGTLPSCGDGTTDLCEQCDLGSDNGPDSACTPLCMDAVCGDGFLHEGVEECDGDLFDPDFADCPEGYEGTPTCSSSCEVDFDSCQPIDMCGQNPNLCPNGTCVNDAGSYYCDCDSGYELNSNGQCVNIDECANGTHTCDENATCTDTPGSYNCACNPGFEGNGEVCTDIDECANPGLNTCADNAICTNLPGGYECDCAPGYDGDGHTCTDIDECADPDLNTCDENASCTNLPGSYQCECDAGYDGDGETCTDIDECADPDLNRCDENATCTNTDGGYTCECDEGYIGDGYACGDRECTEEEAAQCGETGSCAVNDNVVQCTCGEGYELNDAGECVDIDECADDALNSCDENATCTNTDGGYTCECLDGFEGNGHTCEDIDECADDSLNDCHENAICTNTPGGHTCECEDGYVADGTSCGERECTEDEAAQCGETGSCSINDNEVDCSCGEGFELDADGACVDIDECADDALNSCDENAACTNNEGGYTCECLDGFEGDGEACTELDEETKGTIAGGGLASCSSTSSNPLQSPLALLAVVMGGFAALRRRR